MKVIFVGGGTGGHFYPLIAVANKLILLAKNNKMLEPKMYYVGPDKYDEKELYSSNLEYIYCPSGKFRRTMDPISLIKNFIDIFALLLGILKGIIIIYRIFPDVVFSKGGYASFPILYAAKLFRIPVIIHESDAKLGIVSRWSARFAYRIAINYPDVEIYLNEKQLKKTSIIGIPLRSSILKNKLVDSEKYFKIDPDKKTILVLGGSSGSSFINNSILDILPNLLEKYQVIHQTGDASASEINTVTKSIFKNRQDLLNNYKQVKFLTPFYLRAAYSIADLVITRAGSTTLAEIAEWELPSIVIPIPIEISHDQTENAFAYAKQTNSIIIEQKNILRSLFFSQVDNLLNNDKLLNKMVAGAKSFKKSDAADKIANQILKILLQHEI